MEIPFFPDLIFKESSVRLLYPLREIAEEHESGNVGILKHCHIFDLHEFPLIAWRRRYGNLFKHIGVELRSGDYALAVFVYFSRSLQNLVDSFFGQSRSEKYGEVCERCEAVADGCFIAFLSLQRAVLDQIPLIDAPDQPFLIPLDKGEDVLAS